ncbi:MAG TPA: nucleotide sugar dehydrogenase [Solirubrobacterales bacterium]|nr:nucleotide sugar dehydrogenase [Solirubrobacterales bacterium]
MSAQRESIGVIGVGWVGLVTAACFAELGHPVVARDIVAAKVEALSRGETTIHEPGLEDLVRRNAERLTFTTDMGELLDAARILFVCVDTPPTRSGDADLSRVRSVVADLRDDSEHVLVMKSTVPAGTGAAIRRDAPRLSYVSCPEFLKEGSAVEDFMHPDRVVIGADPGDEEAGDAVAAIYEPLGGEIVRTDVASAEMIKLASNAFLATKISFVNEIANVCEEVGADVGEVARGMGLDQRIGSSFLRAGIGYGGSCFDGSETLLVRHHGTAKLVSFEELWALAGGDPAAEDGEAIAPTDLFAWSWVPGESKPEWMPVSVLTKRHYDGDMVEIKTKMGRRVRVTADHPVIVGDGQDDEVLTTVRAEDLTAGDWLPLAGGASAGSRPFAYSTVGAIEGGFSAEEVIVRPRAAEIEALSSLPLAERATLGTARNGTYVPERLPMDEVFWRVVGLYVAEGYAQRVPNLLWDQTEARKWAFLSGLWEGDGSWSLVNGGPSVTLDFGTVSDELADGVARLLGDLGIVCSWRRGRTSKSTKDTHWLKISGADQVERALALVPEAQRAKVLSALKRQSKRIAPSGHRRFDSSRMAWVRVTGSSKTPFRGSVYSLEVPGASTAAVSGGLVLHNCFPKDVSALKMLAGNTGYHFQLLNAVIEVNELQKRRVVGKLLAHLGGSLVGRKVALLGLAFKPHTDDMREASSLVLAARLQGEGAEVVAYDPVATEVAREVLSGVELSESALGALDGADAAVLVTEWPEFRELNWSEAASRMARPLVVDGRNFLDPGVMAEAGFEYEGIGRSVQGAPSPATTD